MRIPWEPICALDPAGAPVTPAPIAKWVTECGARFVLLQEQIGREINARVWPYRYGGRVMIACDIGTRADNVEGLTFNVGGPHNFDLVDPVVPDAAEALHMIGLLCAHIGADVELGRRSERTTTRARMSFTIFAKAAYLEGGAIALMSSGAVKRNDLPTGFVRYLTAAECWSAGLPVAEAAGSLANGVVRQAR